MNTDRIVSNVKRKRRVRIIAGMIDSVPGFTYFRIRLKDGRQFDFEGSTAVLTHQPRMVEQQMIEFIDERK